MSKTYFFHTTKLDIVKFGLAPAATIALRKEGDKILYGVTICSKYDNFSRKFGREISESRLNQGFGSMEVPNTLEYMGLTEHEICLKHLFILVTSVVKKTKRWKKKIEEFSKPKEEAKIIELTPKS